MLLRIYDFINKKVLQFFSTSANSNNDYLVFFRVSVGIIAIVDVVSMFPDFKLFFSNESAIIPQELTYLFTDYFKYLNPFYTLLSKSMLYEFFYDNALWIYLLMLFFMVIGFLTRFSVLMALLLQLVIFKSFDDYNYGYDYFLTTSLFYCLIFPVGKYFAIDLLFFSGKIKYNFNYARVIQIHLYIIYFFAGLPKLINLTWWNGMSMWTVLADVYKNFTQTSLYFLVAAGIFTALIETFYPILMSIKRTRTVSLMLIIAMHAGIAIVMDLYTFAAIMIALNLTAFYTLIPDFNVLLPNRRRIKT